jgi:putative FmdB family regulatory protein
LPTYQYACTACGHQLEAVQSFADEPLVECPACEGKLRKLFSAVGIVFKGSGFYRTDSRAGAGSSATVGSSDSGSKAGGESKASESKSSESKGESKSGESKAAGKDSSSSSSSSSSASSASSSSGSKDSSSSSSSKPKAAV